MSGNDQLTIEARYNWRFKKDEDGYIYQAKIANGIYLIVYRELHKHKWKAVSKVFGKIDRIEGYQENTVNELVLRLENY